MQIGRGSRMRWGFLMKSIFLTAAACWAAWPPIDVRADEPIVKFVSVPDFINMDMQFDDPRLFDLTSAREAQLVSQINSGGPQASINPNVGNFVGTVENGYRGASQVLLEALAAENADFFTVSGDLLYTRWPKGSQLTQPWAAQHIRDQADIYYDDWIQSRFDLRRFRTRRRVHDRRRPRNRRQRLGREQTSAYPHLQGSVRRQGWQ